MNIIVIKGQKACGKTRNAERLASYFKAEHIVEFDDLPRVPFSIKNKTLVLTNRLVIPKELEDVACVITFSAAMSMMEGSKDSHDFEVIKLTGAA